MVIPLVKPGFDMDYFTKLAPNNKLELHGDELSLLTCEKLLPLILYDFMVSSV